jgi:hypothetical protein
MSHRTSQEVFGLVLESLNSSQFQDTVNHLRSVGHFTRPTEGVIERLQFDEVFRRRLISDQTLIIQFARNQKLSAHEVIAICTAAIILAPKTPPPLTPQFLAAVLMPQELDFSNVRDAKIRLPMERLDLDSEYARAVVYEPTATLGPEDLNRVEFIIVYLHAAVRHATIAALPQIAIAEEFLLVARLSSGEVVQMLNDLRK